MSHILASNKPTNLNVNAMLIKANYAFHVAPVQRLNKTDVNIREIQILFTIGSRRIITPLGKNIVIETLALSKLNHLILLYQTLKMKQLN